MRSDTRKSILIVDPDLKSSMLGHFYRYDKSVLEILEANGFNVKVLCNSMFESADIRFKNVLGHFFIINSKISSFFNAFAIPIQIANLYRKEVGLGSIFFFPNIGINILLGVIFGQLFNLKENISTIIFYRYTKKGFFWRSLRHSNYYWLIYFLKKSSVSFVSDSHLLLSELKLNYKRHGRLLPIPHKFNCLDTYVAETNTTLFKVYVPGKISRGKSLGVLLDFILFFNPKSIRFIIQTNISDLSDHHKLKLNLIQAKNDSLLEIRKPYLSDSEVLDVLNASHVILLPYSSLGYDLQTSGFFSEAVSLSKVVVVSRETWMQSVSELYNLSVPTVDIKDISSFNLLIEIKNNFNQYLNIAQKNKVNWDLHNSNDKFIKNLLA